MKLYEKIEEKLNKLLGQPNCSCHNYNVWDEENWYYETEKTYTCTECFIRDGLIEFCYRSIVGKIQLKTVAKMIIKIHKMTCVDDNKMEIDNIKLLQFISKLDEYKKKEEKEKIKLQKQYKKYIQRRKAKCRKEMQKRLQRSYGGTI